MILFLSVGLGWQLLGDTVRMVSPNYVIQLTAHNKHNNIDPLSLPRLSGHGWSRLSQVTLTPCPYPACLDTAGQDSHR